MCLHPKSFDGIETSIVMNENRFVQKIWFIRLPLIYTALNTLFWNDWSYLQGRALSRAKSRRKLEYTDVLNNMRDMGIAIRVASPKLVMEEAPESYKNVTDVVDTCHAAGISKKTIKLRPIAVIKGWMYLFWINIFRLFYTKNRINPVQLFMFIELYLKIFTGSWNPFSME